MKKFISVLLLALMILSLFCGCGNAAKAGFGDTAVLSDDGPIKMIELPEDGIVAKSYFDSAKKNGTMLTVKGKSGDFGCQWSVFGAKITEARDCNMSVDIKKEEEGIYTVDFAEETDYMPSFGIRLDGVNEYNDAVIYDKSGNPIGSAALTVYADYSDVSFYVNENTTGIKLVLSVLEDGDTTVYSSENIVTGGNTASGNIGDSDYLSPVSSSGGVSASAGKDKYNTDPIPEGKPKPVEPEDQTIGTDTLYCTFSISCSTILDNMDICNEEKKELVPSDGWILKSTKVAFTDGESVFDVLQRVCRENGIHMESEWTPMYNSAYIEGINNLYEFDVGDLSGWMYKVNGWFPNYGCSRYALKDGDVVAWCYTCDLGYDVGGGYAVGG